MVTINLLALCGNRVIHSIMTRVRDTPTEDLPSELHNMMKLMENDSDHPNYYYSLVITEDRDDYNLDTRIINWHGFNIPNFLKL